MFNPPPKFYLKYVPHPFPGVTKYIDSPQVLLNTSKCVCSIMMDGRMDSAHSSRRPSMTSTRNDSLEVDDAHYFDGFDWSRSSPSPEHIPAKRMSQPIIPRQNRSGSLDPSGFSRSYEHRKGFRKEKSLDLLENKHSSSPRHGARGRLSRSRNSSMESYGYMCLMRVLWLLRPV